MNDFTRKQTVERVKKLFDSFEANYGKELSEAIVLDIMEENLRNTVKKHIELTLGDVGLKTQFDTVEILKKGEYKTVAKSRTPQAKKKKATKKKVTKNSK